jgi:hypothetical protein
MGAISQGECTPPDFHRAIDHTDYFVATRTIKLTVPWALVISIPAGMFVSLIGFNGMKH